MPYYRRIAGTTFFFSVVAYRRRAIFCDDAIRQALNAAIRYVRARHPFCIDAWVLLPDHMHAIWTLPDGDHDFLSRWAMIKRLYQCSVVPTIISQKHRPTAPAIVANQRSGSDGFGSIGFAMSGTWKCIWITCISIRCGMGMRSVRPIGSIRRFIGM
jgi:REP element-mobilizing transposase RayT